MFKKREEGFLFNNLTEEEIQKDLKMINLNICFQLDKHIALAPYYMNAEKTIEVNDKYFFFFFNKCNTL